MEILEKYIAKSPETASRIIEEEAVVVQPGISQVNTFNRVATRIWDLADGKKKVLEIIAELEQEYDVEPKQVTDDSIEFINRLLTDKMLVISNEPAGNNNE